MIPNSLQYEAYKQMLHATLDCIFEKRGFHFHGSPQALKYFRERLTAYYCLNYDLDMELQWPADLCM